MSELLRVAREAALAGGAVVRQARERGGFRVSEKAPSDYVTEVDVASERAIAGVLREAFPDHAIVGEEGTTGPAAADARGMRWIVDPLDGTTNFIRGIPCFAVSVGVERDGIPVAGAILDATTGALYGAERGGGAWCGDERLAVSAETRLSQALVLTGIPFRDLGPLPRYLGELERLARATAGIRRMGSAALDLALIASGRAEAFWEHRLSRWDTCAGVVLVEEAGGRASDLAGGSTHLDSGDILVSNGRLHDALLDRLRAPS